jgi:hypothetical protein
MNNVPQTIRKSFHDDCAVVNHVGSAELPLQIDHYNASDCDPTAAGTVGGVDLWVQVFHLDLQHFPVNKAVATDDDARRPLFLFQFPSIRAFQSFWAKRGHYALASVVVMVAPVTNDVVATLYAGKSLPRARKLAKWLNHLEVLPCPVWAADVQVIVKPDGEMLACQDITLEQLFTAIETTTPLSTTALDPNHPDIPTDIGASVATLKERDLAIVH